MSGFGSERNSAKSSSWVGFDFRGAFFQRGEIAVFAAMDKAFGNLLQLFPTGADGLGFFLADLVVACGGGDDREKIRKFLHNLIGGRDQEIGVGPMDLGIVDEKAAGPFAEPLDQPGVLGAFEERFDAVQWVGGTAAGAGLLRCLGPFINERDGQPQVGGDLLRIAFVENLPEQLVGFPARAKLSLVVPRIKERSFAGACQKRLGTRA
jgi:hypothetical protein